MELTLGASCPAYKLIPSGLMFAACHQSILSPSRLFFQPCPHYKFCPPSYTLWAVRFEQLFNPNLCLPAVTCSNL